MPACGAGRCHAAVLAEGIFRDIAGRSHLGDGHFPPSFYAAFGSKEALYAEAVAHYGRSYGAKAWDGFEKAATAREAMRTYLMDSAAFAGVATQAEDPPGCMLALSAVGDEGNAFLGDIVRTARAQTLQRLEDRVARAVAEGEISASQAGGRARFILAVQGGLSLQARDGASREDLEAIIAQAMCAWDASPGAPATA